jgi:hypothetical protein
MSNKKYCRRLRHNDLLFLEAKCIVNRVYEFAPVARDDFLTSACFANEALKREVRHILFALHGPEDDFLEIPPLRIALPVRPLNH